MTEDEFEDNAIDLYDEDEEAASDCGQFLDGGVIVCSAAGSEWCDFECPLRRDLGLTPAQAEERAIDEVCAELQAEREARGNAEYDSWGGAIESRAKNK